MYRISKRFDFSASHVLDGLPTGHQCGRLHGHNYVVELELSSGAVNDVGFVVDYGELGPFRALLDGLLDHRHLNDVVDFNPTAENLASWLYAQADHLDLPVSAVRVMETPKTMAEYRR